jgi:signal peptidase II
LGTLVPSSAVPLPVLALWIFLPRRATAWDSLAKALILGGAFGNLWDRMRFHAVRDFIDLHFGSYRYPTFNVADIALVVGIVMLLLKSFRREPSERAA